MNESIFFICRFNLHYIAYYCFFILCLLPPFPLPLQEQKLCATLDLSDHYSPLFGNYFLSICANQRQLSCVFVSQSKKCCNCRINTFSPSFVAFILSLFEHFLSISFICAVLQFQHFLHCFYFQCVFLLYYRSLACLYLLLIMSN